MLELFVNFAYCLKYVDDSTSMWCKFLKVVGGMFFSVSDHTMCLLSHTNRVCFHHDRRIRNKCYCWDYLLNFLQRVYHGTYKYFKFFIMKIQILESLKTTENKKKTELFSHFKRQLFYCRTVSFICIYFAINFF